MPGVGSLGWLAGIRARGDRANYYSESYMTDEVDPRSCGETIGNHTSGAPSEHPITNGRVLTNRGDSPFAQTRRISDKSIGFGTVIQITGIHVSIKFYIHMIDGIGTK